MGMKSRRLMALSAAVLVAATAAGQHVETTSEADLKVAFLLNFARFVRWPPETATNVQPFVVGVLEVEPLRDSLARLEGRTVRDRAFRVRHCRGTNDAAGCHILLVNSADAGIRKTMLDAARDKPILTVGESSDFLDSGGMIRFVLRNERLRLHISRKAASRAGLEISARLLEVAEKVFDDR